MNDYSIELATEKIDNPQTRTYFREVLSSYHSENYRSAVVMLWSVIICDLIYKLQHLRDIDNDVVAKDILSKVESKQKESPNNPDWEIYLLKLIREKTELLDVADFTNLNAIQQIRHLSAHPVLNNTDLLFTPHKEQTRSFIRIALESVLTKPPVFLRNIVEELVSDIASKKEILIEEGSLKRYTESKYFRRLRSATENHLFRALWKFVFRLENDDTNENREINYRCLNILYKRRPDELRNLINENQDFFGNIGGENSLPYLIRFLSENPLIYGLLNTSAKVIIENYSNSSLSNFAISFFCSENVNTHLNRILKQVSELTYTSINDNNEITGEAWSRILPIGHENQCNKALKQIAILMYVKSGGFDTANVFFERFIDPIMAQFDEDDLNLLISKIEGNDQTYNRRRGNSDHKRLMDACSASLPSDFRETDYPNFFNFKTISKEESSSEESSSVDLSEIPF